MATSNSYQKAKASVEKATRNFTGVETIGAKEVLQLRKEGMKVVLVDVRTEEEMEVSMLSGAQSRETFERSRLGASAANGRKFQESAAGGKEEDGWDLVVPYCTVGYRSGQYAKKLLDLGYPSVRNSEGVVLWTHEVGSGFIATVNRATNGGTEQQGKEEQARPKNDSGNVSGSDSDSDDGDIAGEGGIEVKRVHVYGPPWDHAREDFETVAFPPTGCRVVSAVASIFAKLFKFRK